MPCPGKRQEEQPAFPLWSGHVRAAAASPLQSVIGIHVQLYSWPVLLYLLQKNNTITIKEVHGVLHKWLAFDCLFELRMESHRQYGLSRGWLVFCFCFYFLILSHCIYQLLTHHFEGGGNVALLFVSFFIIFFIIIIKGLTFSSHHCEITELFEWYVTLKRLVCCFCAVSVLGWGWAGGEGIGNGGAAEVL